MVEKQNRIYKKIMLFLNYLKKDSSIIFFSSIIIFLSVFLWDFKFGIFQAKYLIILLLLFNFILFKKKDLTYYFYCLVFCLLVFGYWVVQIFFSQWKTPMRFISGSVYFCTMDVFFRILKQTVSELICTRLYCKKWYNIYNSKELM